MKCKIPKHIHKETSGITRCRNGVSNRLLSVPVDTSNWLSFAHKLSLDKPFLPHHVDDARYKGAIHYNEHHQHSLPSEFSQWYFSVFLSFRRFLQLSRKHCEKFMRWLVRVMQYRKLAVLFQNDHFPFPIVHGLHLYLKYLTL